MTFREFPKIKRYFREIIVTEKLDGTNAAVAWLQQEETGYTFVPGVNCLAERDGLFLIAQSRSKIIFPGKATDNFGFAGWAKDNADELFRLGHGYHYGEWWGKGIQRGYDLAEKRFSLFNTSRWTDPTVRPTCCHVVPVLYQGMLMDEQIEGALQYLEQNGSEAAPGYKKPEGIIIYHTAADTLFKYTLDGDGHKGAQ